MSVIQSVASLQNLVSGPISRSDGADITADTVEMALLAYGSTPAEDDWESAAWVAGGPPYQAAILVAGPDVASPPGTAVVVEAGAYAVWVRVTDDPEIPVQVAGRLIMVGPSNQATTMDLLSSPGTPLDVVVA